MVVKIHLRNHVSCDFGLTHHSCVSLVWFKTLISALTHNIVSWFKNQSISFYNMFNLLFVMFIGSEIYCSSSINCIANIGLTSLIHYQLIHVLHLRADEIWVWLSFDFFIAFKLFKRRNVSMPAGGPEDFAGGNLHDSTVSSTPYTVSIMQF